jgi:thiol:disulfide interchange protein
MNLLRRLAVAFVAGAALAAAALGQDVDPIKVGEADVRPVPVLPGGRVAVRVDVEVDPAYHVYGLTETNAFAPKFHAPKAGWPTGLAAGTPTESPAPKKEDSAVGPVLVHRGKISFTLPFTVAADAAAGPRDVAGEIELQACDEGSCLAPRKYAFKATVYVSEPSTVKVARVEFAPAKVARGGAATLEIEFAIEKGWHLYAQRHPAQKPPKFEWTLPPGWTEKGALVEATPPHEIDFFGEKLFVHEGKAVVRQTFAVAADAPQGATKLVGAGTWQRCDEGGCVDDLDVPVSATADVGAAGVAASPQDGRNPPPPAPEREPPKPAPEKKDPPPAPQDKVSAPPPKSADDAPSGAETLGSVLMTGMLFGFFTVLTPCVFPLLPVTVSFFVKQKGPALPRSLVYAAGIVFTFTVVGLVFKGSLDTFARGSIFNAAVGVLFIALALSLFGLFDLRLPSFFVDQSQARGSGGGLLGAFFMAVTLALTSFSCSFPFLATMFANFKEGDYVLSVAGLMAYGSVVALPFFLCSLFPTLLTSLPRSGSWMNAIKVTMGFVELALAFKFLRTVALNQVGSDAPPDVLQRPLVLAIWVACALAAALYLFGYLTLPHDTKAESIGVVRLLFAVTFLTFAAFLVPGVFGRPSADWIDNFLQVRPSEITWTSGAPDGSTGGAVDDAWPQNDWDGALTRAAEKRRPALFDFTGVG